METKQLPKTCLDAQNNWTSPYLPDGRPAGLVLDVCGYLILPENIVRVQGMSNYCKLFFADHNKPLIVSKVLRWVQERLPPDMFARVHRSHLVNKQHVRQIKGNHTKTLLMGNGDQICVSRRKTGLANKKVLGMAVA